MTTFSRITNIDLNDKREMVKEARKGVSASLFVRFAKLASIPENKLAQALNVHAKTIHNHIDNKKKLDPIEGEHLLRLIALYAKGESILGDMSEFTRWLQISSGFGENNYISLLSTPGGVDIVSEELARIAEGYPV